jgi:type IV secretory pathway VirB10-like protein
MRTGKDEKTAMELLLARYARKLLMKYRIHDLHYLSKVVLGKKITDILRRGVKRTHSSELTTTTTTTTTPTAAPPPPPPQPSESTPTPTSTQISTPPPSRSSSLFAFLSFASPAPAPPDPPASTSSTPPDHGGEREKSDDDANEGEGEGNGQGDDREANGNEEAAAAEDEPLRPEPLRNIINSNDFRSALLALHLQFGVPFPQRYSPSRYFTLLSSLHAGLGEGGIAMGTPPSLNPSCSHHH